MIDGIVTEQQLCLRGSRWPLRRAQLRRAAARHLGRRPLEEVGRRGWSIVPLHRRREKKKRAQVEGACVGGAALRVADVAIDVIIGATRLATPSNACYETLNFFRHFPPFFWWEHRNSFEAGVAASHGLTRLTRKPVKGRCASRTRAQ